MGWPPQLLMRRKAPGSAPKSRTCPLPFSTPVGMMAQMRSVDVRDELADGIDVAPMPPQAPDGMLAPFPPATPVAEAPPRLCEYGPCRHYHRFQVQVDAENPKNERIAGRLVVHARVFHVETQHYCYPDVGIETVLGAMPVLACNRWAPAAGLLRVVRRLRARRRYEADLLDWQARRDDEARALAEAAGLLEPPRDLVVVFRKDGAETAVRQEIDGEATIAALVQLAVRATHHQIEQVTYSVEIDDAPVRLDATISELELPPDTHVIVHLSHEPKEPT